LAWVAAAALLVAGHLVISPVTGRTAASTDGSIRNQNVVDEYLVAMLRPTRISEKVQPMMGMFAPAVTPTELAAEGNSL
jgi:hypothetical protein